jgi:hypothetical protein
MNNFNSAKLRFMLVFGISVFSSSALSTALTKVYPDIEPIEYKLEKPIVRASSELKDAGGRYHANNVVDHDYRTAWCEGAINGGADEWLQFSFQKKTKIHQSVSGVKVRIIPGYVKSNSLFFLNSRPHLAEISISVAGEPSRTIARKQVEVVDRPNAQVFRIDLNKTRNFHDLIVTINFKGVFKGKSHSDMCVSEIEVLPLNGGIYAAPHNEEINEFGGGNDEILVDSIDANKAYEESVEQSLDEIHFLRLLNGNYKDNPVLMFEAINWMAHSSYFRSAEGEESVKELWLDLYVKHPYEFLRALELQENEVREFILQNALIRQVNDKYGYKILYQSALRAKRLGISHAVVSPLINEFSIEK